jgi:ankyrin repeat protein
VTISRSVDVERQRLALLSQRLAKAVGQDNIRRIRDLCRMGGDPNARLQPNGATIFMGAAHNGNKFTTHTLLTYGRVNLHLKTADGRSAMMIAHSRGHAEIVQQMRDTLLLAARIKRIVFSSEKRTLDLIRQRPMMMANTVVNASGDTALQLAARLHPTRVTAIIAKAMPTEYLSIGNIYGRTIAEEIEDVKPIFLRPRNSATNRPFTDSRPAGNVRPTRPQAK